MSITIAAILDDVRNLPPEDIGTLRLAILAARVSTALSSCTNSPTWNFFNALSEALDCNESRAAPAYGVLYRLYVEPAE
jgi:hypothetical protein